MLIHGRKEGRDRHRYGRTTKSWEQSEKSYPTLPPAKCQINLKVFSAKRLRDVARSRGPHPFGRSGKVDFCVLRVFCVKSTGPRARERKYARRRMDFRSLFLRIFGLRTQACGRVSAKFFSQLLRRQTSPIGQKRSDDRSLLKTSSQSSVRCGTLRS